MKKKFYNMIKWLKFLYLKIYFFSKCYNMISNKLQTYLRKLKITICIVWKRDPVKKSDSKNIKVKIKIKNLKYNKHIKRSKPHKEIYPQKTLSKSELQKIS